MMSFQNKFFLTLFSLFLLNLPGLLSAQEEAADAPTLEDSKAAPETFSIMLNGRDITVDGTGSEPEEDPRYATGGPLDIIPNPYLDPEDITSEVILLAQQAATEAQEPSDEEEASGFEGATLDPLDPGSVGLITGAEAGFPPNLWLGSDPDVLPGLISALPAGTKSPTTNALLARLLLSSAAVPTGFTGKTNPEDFLFARLERLYEAGDIDSLMEMFDQITREERSPRLTGLMAETYFLDGDFDTGCRLAGEGQRAAGSAKFLKINAICQALEGREAEARFNISLLQEAGEADFAFVSLFEDVTRLAREERPGALALEPGDDSSLSSFFDQDFYLLSDLTPLHIGILKVLGREVELSINTKEVSNLVLAALARWQGLSLETKLLVADLALERGILREKFLKELVGAYQFSASDKENAYLLDYASWGVKSDALFYALALESFDFPEAIQNVQEGWSRARISGRGAYMAALFYEAIADIPADPSFVGFAPDAVRISLLSGNIEKAFAWYSMVRERAAGGDAEATRMLVEMWPMMITLDETGVIPYSPQILNLWRRSIELLSPEEQLARTLLFYEILGNLGFEVPEALANEGMLAFAGELGAGEFIGGASPGETVLLVLGKLGEEDTINASPFTLGDSLYTLTEVDLSREGRLIILEALLARGF
ncbi:MAG: hypothetical protein ACTSU8_04670 [Alphaproteobacteria bacterium]